VPARILAVASVTGKGVVVLNSTIYFWLIQSNTDERRPEKNQKKQSVTHENARSNDARRWSP
jgi:hypothetical protein